MSSELNGSLLRGIIQRQGWVHKIAIKSPILAQLANLQQRSHRPPSLIYIAILQYEKAVPFCFVDATRFIYGSRRCGIR